MASSSNFYFLKEYDPVFFQLDSAAECAFSGDPNTTLIKLRQLAEQMDAEARAYEQLAIDNEKALTQQRQEFEKRIKEMQAELYAGLIGQQQTHMTQAQLTQEQSKQARQQQARQKKAKQQVSERTQRAASQFTLNEALTRIIIDQQLINAGWDADSQGTNKLNSHRGFARGKPAKASASEREA